jgi:hypothetical protein
MSAGRLLHIRFQGLHSVYLHYGLHDRQVAFATLYTGAGTSRTLEYAFHFWSAVSLHSASDVLIATTGTKTGTK